MEGFVLALHIIVCVLLVVIVLLQSGKSADLAGAFGGGGSQSTFGPRGAGTFLSKMTTTLAVLFMVTSLTLWIIAAKKAGTILSKEDIKQEQTTGQTPGQPAEEKPGAAADTDKQTTETDKQTTETETETETEKKENNGSS